MRFQPYRLVSAEQLRRQIGRLGGLPLRAATARHILAVLPEGTDDGADLPSETRDFSKVGDLDPGWVLNRVRLDSQADPLELIVDRPWWPRGAESDALTQLWRHSAAVSIVASRLARELGKPDPARIARAGFLHGLGRWIMAAIDPGWLADWLAELDPARRLERERKTVGTDLATLGREMAESWGCDPLVADAAWLHSDGPRRLTAASVCSDELALIQEAFAWAERTPWAVGAQPSRELSGSDPRLRVLIAEVQVACASAFIEPDATAHEERFARSNARLRLQVSKLRAESAASGRFLRAFSEWDPVAGPEAWAERIGESWCGEPGVSAARAVWTAADLARTSGSENLPAATGPGDAPPARVVTLRARGRDYAEIHLWGDGATALDLSVQPVWAAWHTWAALVGDRERMAARLESAAAAFREYHADEEPRLRKAKLDALAEFAAGAGHELNNPLAVILGRGQLLLSQESDPQAVRSIRAILSQAQRAHRILRDLMYYARPPEPRPRFCVPDEIVRNCLRDFRPDAENRGLRLSADGGEGLSKIWADHDALRHLLETLVRNALEATPRGGKVQISTSGNEKALFWTVQDSGRGINTNDARHLFDPFYCGRQAGRGLGLGLPRAARFVAQTGGEIRWHAAPGQGSVFDVHIPLNAPPDPPQGAAIPSVAPGRSEGR